MKIGRYNIIITKKNLRFFVLFYAFYLTVNLLMTDNIQPKRVLFMSLIAAFACFLIIVGFENYYRNNLHKRKKNWFWSGYDENINVK